MSSEAELKQLLTSVDGLLDDLSTAEDAWGPQLRQVAPEHRESARNMTHYLTIRQQDLRELQTALAALGLSSLGRSEPHVRDTLLAVRAALAGFLDGDWQPADTSPVGSMAHTTLLSANADALFGPPPEHITRIMVTMPSEAADDPKLVRQLIDAGMDVARINCAHDDIDVWRRIADHVRQAAADAGQACLVAVDLAGPKLRTGPLEPGPRVVKLRPRRNPLGQVIAPVRAWLAGPGVPVPDDETLPVLPVSAEWLARRQPGEVLLMHDTRGAKRRLTLTEQGSPDTGFVVTALDTTYLATGNPLSVEGRDDPTLIGEIPQTEQKLVLHTGDELVLTRDCEPAVADEDEPRIGCTLPEVFDSAQVGHRVLFDDGKIAGEVIEAHPQAGFLRIRITRAHVRGSRLRADKGINLPDTRLSVSAPTGKDITDLATTAPFADIVEASFVRDPEDVERLLDVLDRLGADDLGVVLKIETRAGFENLPPLLLAAMRRTKVGVMIARGDLAVECGYERLAEVQEEILWLCEAAHLPVIWATQVLEQLAKSGNPSRAEISDAALGGRAECVMLNKGPYITEAVLALDDILGRMSEHRYKKNDLLRPLRAWQAAPEGVISS